MTCRFIWVALVLALAPPAFADSVSVQWNNPTACTSGSGAYTHLGVNILVNGALVSLVQGTSYAATLNSGDVVTASACGYCGTPPVNGGVWSAHGRCAVGNESAVSNPVTYTSTGTTTPPPVSNGSAPSGLTITLGVAGTAPPAQELDTFATIGSAWSTINTIAAMTVSNGNVQCGTPDVDCGMIRNTTWPANQSSTVTVGAIATNDEVGAFVRATTARMGYMCNQMQGGNAVIFEMNGTSAWNQLASIPGTPLAAGGTLSCSAVGNQITLKVNGVTLLQVTNTAHPTGGRPGIALYDPSSISLRVSDWRGDAL